MNFLQRWFGRKAAGGKATVQTRDYYNSPFHEITGYVPLTVDLKIYDLIREALPICDVAVSKKVRLIGDFQLVAENESVQKFLDDFYRNVSVGHFAKGWRAAQNQIVDSIYAKGFGLMEIVPDIMMTGIEFLKVVRANEFRFRKNDNQQLELCQVMADSFRPIILEKQDLINYSAFELRDGHPQGVSMFSSLPFLAQIVLRIQMAIDNMIWRIGDPTFYHVYTPGPLESADEAHATSDNCSKSLKNAMMTRRSGGISDLGFTTGPSGSFTIKILGADAKFIDIQVPYRTIQEQIIAKTGFPPFYFGLSWSTTERMSQQQADMLIADVQNDRNTLDAVIEKVFDMALILNGMAGAKWKHEWYPVNLQDEKTTADARYVNAQALEKEVTVKIQLRDAGFLTDDDILEFLVESGLISEKKLLKDGREKILVTAEERYNKKQIEIWSKVITQN